MTIIRHLFIAITTMLVCAGSAAAAGSPSATIERFNETLLTIMQQADMLRFDGRHAKLQPVLEESFDLPFMAKFSAGRHWREMSPEQQERLIDVFSRLWISTYADRFSDYSGESFEIVEVAPAPRDTRLVRTNIVKKSGEKIALDYLMRQNGDGWAVIDIFLKGKFSELAKQRSEYTSILRREGLDGLAAKVDKKVQHMKANDK